MRGGAIKFDQMFNFGWPDAQSTDALGKLSRIAYDADGRPVRAAA